MSYRSYCMILLVVLAGCKKLVEVSSPATAIVRSEVFTEKGTALAAMAGVYNKLVNSASYGGSFGSLTITQGVYADELVSYAGVNSTITPFYQNTLTAANSSVSGIWSVSYEIIYSCNAVIEGLHASPVAQADKDQLTGEALAVRAFVHFYLLNLFGDIPYISTTDYEANAKVVRMPATEVYKAVIADLQQAKTLLKNDYPSIQRVCINKGAATALLARVFLYNKEWGNAEAQATELINNSIQYSLLTDLNKVFLKNSTEAIWQLIPSLGGATAEGQLFILLAPPTFVALKPELANVFEDNDKRKTNWIDSLVSASGFTKWYYPKKYKEKLNATGAEYSMVLRLAEQYLIRAEARAMQNKLTGPGSAASDIDALRSRAGLSGTTAGTQQQLLDAIEKERVYELFTEMGQRFFDLKRWSRLDAVLDSIKPNWETHDALFPIPQTEILNNPRLTQNQGY